MNERGTGKRTRDRSTALIDSRRMFRARKRKLARLPWWREPPVGYAMTLPLVGLGLLIPFGFQQWGIKNVFLDTPLVMVTLIIALTWGTEPAVFSILLGTLAFDVYFLSPPGSLLHPWPVLLQLIPFVLAATIMVALAAQRERSRRQILFTRRELESYADELQRLNQELLRANQELEHADQLKDHFLSMASHELKTPITTIRGHAQLGMRRLATQTDLPPELASLSTALERIDQQTFRLNNLVDDLLDLSILRSGKIALRPAQCDVGATCFEIIQEQQSLTGRNIELETPSSPVVLQADCERLSQVVTNLVTNAVKYSPGDSPIQVRVSQSRRTAMIQVHNAGPAIPQEQQANIFEPFYRTPAAQSSQKKGWGLGLAISKQIIERHQGRIWVESTEGKGTTFSVELPVVMDKAADRAVRA
jgi:signal transduction histidine kinase